MIGADGLFERAKTLWRIAIGIGAAVFAGGLGWAWAETDFDWVWWVAAFGLGAIAHNLAFAALCAVWAPGLSAFIVEEDVKVEGGDVVHETAHAETGTAAADFYIRAYATARGASVAALSAVILGGLALAFFG